MPSTEAQTLASDLDLMGSSLESFAGGVLPVGAGVLAFVILAWVIKRMIYV